jgi:CHAT domain-containing protein
MLSYLVGEESVLVFAVLRRGPIEVHKLPVGRAELERRIEFFRDLIFSSASPSEPRGDRAAEEVRAGRELFSLLMGPVLDKVKKTEHLLILPDGSLHLLPWSALVLDHEHGKRRFGRGWQYLIERAPIHVVLSATIGAELRQERRRPRPILDLAAFGDPFNPQEVSQTGSDYPNMTNLGAVIHSLRLSPLPGSRAEVTRISALFPRSSRIFLGRDATEGQVKELPRRVRFLHFAAHGILNRRFPLDSAVALAIPSVFEDGKDNGLLQAWRSSRNCVWRPTWSCCRPVRAALAAKWEEKG